MPTLREIHRTTPETYEAHARAYDQQRMKIFFEKDWLDRFIAYLPAGGTVLDIGCGAGEPIARYLFDQGLHLTGVDSSATMIAISRSRFPEGEWLEQDMRNLSLSRSFDGIVGWDSFFHLNPPEQRSTLDLFCRHLNPDGALLLTIGHEAGEVLGFVNGQQVYHSSLDPKEYEQILLAAGFAQVAIVLRDKKCGEHSVLLASGYKPESENRT
jgi:SAM-dependent methyltransferase